MKNKIQNALGLSQRAGKCLTGDELLDAIGKNKVSLVVLANDASERTKSQIQKKCDFKNIKVIDMLSKEELSQSIGKVNRAAVGIADAGFSKLIKTYLKG